MKEADKGVNPQLWHACAGGMIQMPLPSSNVYYFPQGHAEHTLTNVDFSGMPRVPALILCRVIDVKFLADLETDEVYAKIRLMPLGNIDNGYNGDVDDGVSVGTRNLSESSEKPSSFAKTLTQSDANNGGGFSVPRYCAETIFPRLDYSADPPVQTVIAKDVHGETWKFRHIYRGTPRRHLLTTGWSTFVNQKKLVAGDSIVFVRAENGDLCVGIRRAKRGGAGGPDSSSGWNSYSGSSASFYGGFSAYLRDNENKLIRSGSNRNINSSGRGKVRPEDVIEATSLAANGQPFEVAYYPRASTPDFCVKASSLTASLSSQWCAGMRFKMPFETEDSSRISWFMGTVSSVEVADPFHWPNSPWRLLQVTWDEPDLLQNVKRVSPWLVELVSSMPVIHLSPFSPQRKKLRLPQPPDLPQGDYTLSSFSGNPLGPSSPFCCPPDNVPASIQGARHARFGIPLLDLNVTHKLQLGLFPSSLKHLDSHAKDPDDIIEQPMDGKNDDISCLLTMGSSSLKLDKSDHKVKAPLFLLFGQPIHIEQQISSDQVPVAKPSSNRNANEFLQSGEHGLNSGHCKVFLESEDVGRTIDLSVLESYEELEKTLANLFGIETFNSLPHVLYKDSTGDVKRIGDEPFSEFARKARRLTIPLDACNLDDKRKWNTNLQTGEYGVESSNQTGPMTIFA
ncbi:auxin response factor 18 [Cynara cardunculus var. scolymus]|uniref:Auxin response factor n=1 Tax=Cynara cardunculus var. scolymus TaxID=59895 RepID=A0A103YHU8_CYNCS|nr:auxin response factor 18 [Cynara cardunculus var. scolymus]KVI09337.1 Aux/IAA-ARF-dimerization [Cynara cardunculus var. scolymus]